MSVEKWRIAVEGYDLEGEVEGVADKCLIVRFPAATAHLPLSVVEKRRSEHDGRTLTWVVAVPDWVLVEEGVI